MKVVTASEMGRTEQLAYQAGASDARFMYEAGLGVAQVVVNYIHDHDLEWRITLLCGKGNNAGDTYVAGSALISQGYAVRALQLTAMEGASELCRVRYQEFRDHGGEIIAPADGDPMPFLEDGVIVDGLLGTGISREVSGSFAHAIEQANASGLPIIAVDIPSGVSGDEGLLGEVAIHATVTAFLGLPKTGFFLEKAWNHMGSLAYVDFGLPDQQVDEAHPNLFMVTEEIAASLLPIIPRSQHKYEAGYVVGLAGSAQMPGAAALAGFSALRSGAGIARLLFPKEAQDRLGGLPAELIAQVVPFDDATVVIDQLNKGTACFLGPGLGQSDQVAHLLHAVLEQVHQPVVIDADGLNNLAAHHDWRLPHQVVLTPHVGEMLRLLGISKQDKPSGLEWLALCQEYAANKQVVLVVKGAPTFIFDPLGDQRPWVVPRGDPGMATAGCGDVLTGVIAAMLSQGLKPLEAAKLGVYLHALAGEFAAQQLTSYSMTASDVTEHLADAFQYLQGVK